MDFVGKRNIWFSISTIVFIVGICSMVWHGIYQGKILNFGIDFTGGTFLSFRFEEPVSVSQVREILSRYGFEKSEIQKYGERDISIRLGSIDNDVRVKIIEDFKTTLKGELLEVDVVGPLIGRELRIQAFWALIVASVLIIIYISIRFEFAYAIAAIIALYHDAILTMGIISLLWRDVNTPFVAAILTIMGYSINDTIVIFDRIRENIKKLASSKMKFSQIVNTSISETLARSINTVLTTLFMVVAILLFGGSTIRDFAIVLFVGFLFGAYSSIFIASPLLFLFKGKDKTI